MNALVRHLPTRQVPALGGSDFRKLHEERLYGAMLALYGQGGFTAVQEATERVKKRLATEFRDRIAREGWIV